MVIYFAKRMAAVVQISSPYFLIIQNEMSEMISHRSSAIGGMTGKRPTSQSFPLSTTRSVPTSQ
jgi:hypothetical protein